jgi:thymidine kinase
MSKLYFRYATMGAGKSLDLLKTAYNYEERNKNVLLLTSKCDNRHGLDKITSRVGLSMPAVSISDTTNIFEYVSLQHSINRYDCILMDEVQFLTKEHIWQLTDIVDKLDLNVITYGLRIDYKGEPFEGSCYLMALADKIEELKTICEFGDKATMNLRTINGESIFEGDQISIGGNESYIPVCRKYFKQELNKKITSKLK